jgi:hypothetical protein
VHKADVARARVAVRIQAHLALPRRQVVSRQRLQRVAVQPMLVLAGKEVGRRRQPNGRTPTSETMTIRMSSWRALSAAVVVA